MTTTSPATTAPAKNGLQNPTVSLTYYSEGQQVQLTFATCDPTFRETIQVLNGIGRPFRLVYG